MIQKNIRYRKGADISEVLPGCAVDLNNVLETGNIQDTTAKTFYNGMQSTAEVGSIVRDQFDVVEFDRSYAKFRKFVNDSENAKK